MRAIMGGKHHPIMGGNMRATFDICENHYLYVL
jgi:hypothetical protein